MNAFSSQRVKREKVSRDALRWVIEHMRERDRAEIYAMRWDEDPVNYLEGQLLWMGDMCCIWTLDGVPVSCQGVVAYWPGVWGMFAYGTDQWPRVVLDMTKHAFRFIVPALLAVKAHRVECRALATHTESRRWIEFLGAREEAVLKAYGKRQEDFILYVWKPEYHVHRRRRWQRQHRGTDLSLRTADAAVGGGVGGLIGGAAA